MKRNWDPRAWRDSDSRESSGPRIPARSLSLSLALRDLTIFPAKPQPAAVRTFVIKAHLALGFLLVFLSAYCDNAAISLGDTPPFMPGVITIYKTRNFCRGVIVPSTLPNDVWPAAEPAQRPFRLLAFSRWDCSRPMHGLADASRAIRGFV